MTTAIIAKNYDDAKQAAEEYGIGHDWIYPHDEKTVRGVRFTRIMFVDGYAEGGVTVELARAIYAQTAALAPITHYELGTSDFDRLIAPFIDPNGYTREPNYTPRHAARDKARAFGLLVAASIGGGIVIAAVVVAVIAGVLPW